MVQKYREISVSISTIVDKRQKRGGSDRQTDGRTDRQTMDRAGPDPIHHSFFEKHSGTSVSIRETGVHFKFNASLTGNQVKAVGGPKSHLKITVSISTIGVDKRQKRGGSDRQTDGRTDRQTENYLLRAPITWRKYIFLHNGDLLRAPITWRKYIFLHNGEFNG